MYMSRNDKNVMTSTNFDKTLKAISLFCLEHKGFNIKFYACAYVYLLLKYIYKHFLMAQLECRRWSTTLVRAVKYKTPCFHVFNVLQLDGLLLVNCESLITYEFVLQPGLLLFLPIGFYTIPGMNICIKFAF